MLLDRLLFRRSSPFPLFFLKPQSEDISSKESFLDIRRPCPVPFRSLDLGLELDLSLDLDLALELDLAREWDLSLDLDLALE